VIVIGTLSKSFGAAGGFVAGPAVTIDFLANAARTFVFDTAPPPAVAAAALAAVRIAFADETPRNRVRAHARRLQSELAGLGFARPDGEPSHVVSIVFGDASAALAVQARLAEHDVLCPAIRPPTVPAGTSRIRIGLTATHDDADVDALVSALARCRPLAPIS
jgi:8-amino-7-oxononanoate synthase